MRLVPDRSRQPAVQLWTSSWMRSPTGRKFRTVNQKDACTSNPIDVALSIPGSRVVEMLERVARERGTRMF